MPSRVLRFLVLALVASLGVGISPPARAQQRVQAVVTTNLDMHQGPGTDYRAVLTIPRGARVGILRCTDRYEWCEVGYAARSGWVSARHLRDTRRRFQDRPVSDIGAALGIELFDFVLRELDEGRSEDEGFDDDRFEGVRRPTPRNVCFYDRPDYRGRPFCAGIGDDARAIADRWDGRVASIRVGKRTSLEICSRRNHRGRCDLLTRDVRLLRGRSAVASYRVHRRRAGDEDDFERIRRACFYEHSEFRGARLCFDAGDGAARLPRQWYDRISSIKVEGGAEARICGRRNFGGRCETITRDLRRLRGYFDDAIGSIEVY
ncbi:peptidase inhibitor family I36 protein [uncultured Nitratireductor sp.]|uniref:peptidase inhibitor family I36 protein n=1 Tax=uncultured Nitratireductor sp. TaxID=520953 RepID=UPI0025D906BE|nr:peptidase inhibitor family I36 protein [uncultured Nitratireductor sp.]